jgi:hypothetical protein
MRHPRFIIIDGKRHLWRDILELRRAQCVEPVRAEPTLFELRDDTRPAAGRSAAGRYREPGLFDRCRQQ